MTDLPKSVAVIGGTGALGLGLASRWARAGITVIIGSRDAGRASETARGIEGATGPAPAGMANWAAAAAAEVVALAVPFIGRKAILESIRAGCQRKVVIDSTVPLVPPKVGTVTLPSGGSAAQMCQKALGEGARVVAAFHSVAADKLLGEGAIDCDVLVCGEKLADRAVVIELAKAAGLRGVHAGPLANAVAPESLTPVLIAINRHYKMAGAGIRITGELKKPD